MTDSLSGFIAACHQPRPTSSPSNILAVLWAGAGRPSRRHAAATASGSRTSVLMLTMWLKDDLQRTTLWADLPDRPVCPDAYICQLLLTRNRPPFSHWRLVSAQGALFRFLDDWVVSTRKPCQFPA